MIYEGTISYLSIDDNGEDKSIRERYIISSAELFSDAEASLYNIQRGRDMDVIALKRSLVKEIANTRSCEDDKVWMAELADTFTGDDGEEKINIYKIILYAKSFDSAKSFISEYMEQGYSMELTSLKRTKFVDVL